MRMISGCCSRYRVARNGWLEKDNVFNTKTLAQVTKELKKRKQRL